MIIDFHAHTFPEKIANKALANLSEAANIPYYTDATNKGIRKSMEKAGVDISVILPVVTAPAQTETVNRVAIELNQTEEKENQSRKLISFGGIHPENENYKEILSYIYKEGIKGIKLHPVFQGIRFDDIRYKRIVEYAMELGLVVITHAGYDLSHPDNDNVAYERMLGLVKDVKPDKIVLAHMGGYGCWSAVEEMVAEYGLYIDTGFTVKDTRRFTGEYNKENAAKYLDKKKEAWWAKEDVLNNEMFLRLVKAAGKDRVLFGSDSPWNDQKEAVENVRKIITDNELLLNILGRNSAKLLNPENF